MALKAAVVGLGQIGMGYDYDLDPEKYILTHSQAIQTHPAFELMGGIDISDDNRKRFEKNFNRPSFAEINNDTRFADLDLMVVAVSTVAHLEIVKIIVSILTPKLILIEKPLSFSFDEAKEIVRITENNNIIIAVNYCREYEPGHRILYKRINSDELGNPLKAVCWYSKGIVNNGTHFIQLLANFMGGIIDIKIIDEGRKWDNIDPEPTLEIIYENGHAYFIPAREENYSLFEMEIIGPKGKIKYYNGGSHYDWWKVSDDSVLKDYRKLKTKPSNTTTDVNKYQYHVYNNIAEYFEGNSNLYCDGKSALKTAQILDQIQQKID